MYTYVRCFKEKREDERKKEPFSLLPSKFEVLMKELVRHGAKRREKGKKNCLGT